MEKHWEFGIYGVLVICVIFLFTLFALPHKHQGYYIYTQTQGHAPVYMIYNDWGFWPDDKAFVTTDREEALSALGQLKGNHVN